MLRGRAGIGLAAAAVALAAAAPADAADQNRAYELVSPVDKGSNDVWGTAKSTDDGDAIAYVSSAQFPWLPGKVYFDGGLVARRGADGWATTSISPAPTAAAPLLLNAMRSVAFSDDLRTFWGISDGAYAAADQNGTFDAYASTGPEGRLLTPRAGAPEAGTEQSWVGDHSRDARISVVESFKPLVSSVSTTSRRVYTNTDGALALASVLPGEVPADNAALGSGLAWKASAGEPTDGGPPEDRAVSADGSRIFFTTLTAPTQVHVRLNGTTTKTLSLSQDPATLDIPAPTGARFLTATDDGSIAYFTSTSKLTDDALANGGLYAYHVDSGDLEFLSKGNGATNATFRGVVRVSEDGRRVYFVARGLLTPDATGSTDKLYLAEGGTLKLIAVLHAQDARVWDNVPTQGEARVAARMTPDGSALVFESRAGIGGAVQTAPLSTQIMRYDVASGTTRCISCRPDLAPPGGSATLLDRDAQVTAGYQQARNITADGDTVFFETDASLLPEDVDAHVDVYAWQDGELELISHGTDKHGAYYSDNSADGSTVFLRTRATLVPEDVDGGAFDVYAARVGGGFPARPVKTPCTGADCRGGLTPAPNAAPAASATFQGAGNAATPPEAPTPAKPRVTIARPTTAQLRSWARTGTATFRVKLTAPGTVRVTARADLRGKTATAASGSVKLANAGTAKVTLRLSAAARRALTRRSQVTVRLVVAATGATRPAATTVVLAGARSAR